ncbi:MAG: serine/threonine protein kinase [Rubripirellula sp.]
MRELFLAAEELPPKEQDAFLKLQTGDDSELLAEVRSLLDEHDAEFAQLEGERAMPVPTPTTSLSTTSPVRRPQSVDHETTRQGESPDATHQSKRSKRKKADITRHGAQRTHASPRRNDGSPSTKGSHSDLLWADRARQSRRRTSGWLWLAALLPTALIGWWTYRQVEATMQQSVHNELKGVVDSIALASERFLNDKAQLIESWSRQPAIQSAIVELVDLAESRPPVEDLRGSDQHERILSQLQSLSGSDEVKFVVWSNTFTTISSWLTDRADVGNPVHPSGAANLARVMTGETVMFGPERLAEGTRGFVPETTLPVMAIIVPIRDSEDQIIAAMLVRGIEMFPEFNHMFNEVSIAGDLDAYAVNLEGLMVTDSPRAAARATRNQLDLPADQIAGVLRVADPGRQVTQKNSSLIQRNICPLTFSAAGATTGTSDVRIQQYNNYAGNSVVGAWRWDDEWKLGIVIEKDAERAFAAAGIVRFGFLLLGSLLSVTAFVVASKLSRIAAEEQAAVHPLSRYDVTDQLGSGGMGVVYRARHRQLGRDTALKVLRGDRHNKEDRLRFDREAKLAASLSNPHSVMIYDYGRSDEGVAFCVMEFLRGLTLQEVVARSGHQPIGRVLFVISQICDALAEAHGMNLLHRDIKPQNVMLSLDASVGDWAVVFDYGLAKPLQPESGVYQTTETLWAGTPMYMAPERFREPSNMDPRSDIYSVGCVAYYLLAGRPPYIECDPESLFALIIDHQPISIATHREADVPEEISQLVLQCMAKDAGDRFENIQELSQTIDRLRVTHPWTVDEARVWWKHHGGE